MRLMSVTSASLTFPGSCLAVGATARGFHQNPIAGLEHARRRRVNLLSVDDEPTGLAGPTARQAFGRRFQLRHQKRRHHVGCVGEDVELEADAAPAAILSDATTVVADLTAN